MALYPLLLEPIYKEKVWGGRTLERLGRTLPGDASTLVGESWEVADLERTSPSGGGGGAAQSIVENGPLRGRSLRDLIRDDAVGLLGRGTSGADGAFPLLVKFLDARQDLSVQVHPSPEYAAAHPSAHLKSEAWYVVAADPGSRIYKGLREGTTRDALESAIAEGRVPDLLVSVPALAGECHYLPSGTCHALGAGIVVAEVQTPSDTTFRLYDWGRVGRELHVGPALESVELGPVDASAFEPGGDEKLGDVSVRELVRCPHFAIAEWSAESRAEEPVLIEGAEVWMVVRGVLTVSSRGASFAPTEVPRARSVLLPAALSEATIELAPSTTALRVTLP